MGKVIDFQLEKQKRRGTIEEELEGYFQNTLDDEYYNFKYQLSPFYLNGYDINSGKTFLSQLEELNEIRANEPKEKDYLDSASYVFSNLDGTENILEIVKRLFNIIKEDE